MPLLRPARTLAGFHAELPEPGCPELAHGGEQWMPAGRTISRHRHPVWEIYLQVEGASRWRSERGEHALAAGGLLVVPPEVEHELVAADAAHHFLFAAFDLDAALEPALRPAWRRLTRHIAEADAVEAPLRLLMREIRHAAPARAEGIRAALRCVLIACTRLLAAAPTAVLEVVHPAVEAARRAMDAHPGQDWPLARLAALGGISPRHLATRFRASLGEPPHRYLLRARIRLAQSWLRETDRAITDIAQELGFASSQHFATTFRRLAGTTALAWRRGIRA